MRKIFITTLLLAFVFGGILLRRHQLNRDQVAMEQKSQTTLPALSASENAPNPITAEHTVRPPKPVRKAQPTPATSPFTLTPEATVVLGQLKAALDSPKMVEEVIQILSATRSALSPMDRSLLLTEFAPLLAQAPKQLSQDLIKSLQVDQFADAQVLGNIVTGELLKSDPAAAAAWVETLDPFVHARQFYQTIGRDWAEQNKDAAVAWINTLQSNMHNQAAAVEGLAESMGTRDLPELIQWANQIEDSYVRGAALLKAAKILSMTDPAGAAKLSLAFTDPLSRRQGIESSLNAWVHQAKNQSEPQNFLSSIQDSNVKSEAQYAYISALGVKDPKAAQAYAQQLPENFRNKVLTLIPNVESAVSAP